MVGVKVGVGVRDGVGVSIGVSVGGIVDVFVAVPVSVEVSVRDAVGVGLTKKAFNGSTDITNQMPVIRTAATRFNNQRPRTNRFKRLFCIICFSQNCSS